MTRKKRRSGDIKHKITSVRWMISSTTTKFNILSSVEECDKTMHTTETTGSTTNISFPKRSMKKYALSARKDYDFMDSSKFINNVLRPILSMVVLLSGLQKFSNLRYSSIPDFVLVVLSLLLTRLNTRIDCNNSLFFFIRHSESIY